MFDRIRSRFARKPDRFDDWSALRDAGYRDVPHHYNRSHPHDRVDRDRLGVSPMGHLR